MTRATARPRRWLRAHERGVQTALLLAAGIGLALALALALLGPQIQAATSHLSTIPAR